ncbi:hypothetical protein [Streptomyces sp. NPDC059168]|uniref:hypothetical protein n=1 Tax=Streptomyces sp. NPDC059168 TaxID=3346753 RepID=UPI00367529BD
MNEKELSRSLVGAGLRWLGAADGLDPLIPPNLATFVSSCSSEDGTIGSTVRLDDPQLRERVNSEWYRLAQSCGLFNEEDRKFLLAVDGLGGDFPGWWWGRVELLDEWDIADEGAATRILGTGPLRPSFVMLSPDGQAILRCDVGEESIDLTALRNPGHVNFLLQQGEWMARSPRVEGRVKGAIERWLSS